MADKRERPPAPPARYTEQIVLLISKDARAVVDIIQREEGITQAAACRALLYAGMRALGYSALKTTDELGNIGAAQHAIAGLKGLD